MILEPWYAAHFRTYTLGDRLPNSFGVLFSLEYNHVMASLLGRRVWILLLAEFQKAHMQPKAGAGLKVSPRMTAATNLKYILIAVD